MSFGVLDPRLPFAPLMAVVERRGWAPDPVNYQALGANRTAAMVLGVSLRTIVRWRRHGLTWDAADKAACSLGLHPASVWGDAFWAEDEEAVA